MALQLRDVVDDILMLSELTCASPCFRSTDVADVTMKATITVNDSYCDKPYRYIGLVLTPGDNYTANDWLTVPVHIDCTSEG